MYVRCSHRILPGTICHGNRVFFGLKNALGWMHTQNIEEKAQEATDGTFAERANTNAHIVDFQIDEEQAQAKHEEWCKEHILSPTGLWAKHAKQVRKVYMPFWRFETTVSTRIINPLANAGLVETPEAGLLYQKDNTKYDMFNENTQIYASFAFRRDFADGVKLNPHSRCTSRKLTETTLSSESTADMHLDTCEMSPGLAWHLALRNIRNEERKNAIRTFKESGLSEKLGEHAVNNLQVKLSVSSRKVQLTYLPTYVLEYTYGTVLNFSDERVPQKFLVILGGTTNSVVNSERHYSPVKAQLAIGSFCTFGFGIEHLISPFLGIIPTSIETMLTASFILCTVGSVAARRSVHARRRERENALLSAQDAESLDYISKRAIGFEEKALLDAMEENEWVRWEESEKWKWSGGHRKQWARKLFIKQHSRRQDIKRHIAAMQLEQMKMEEDARRELAREKKYGKRHQTSHTYEGHGRSSDFMGYYKVLGLEDKVLQATNQDIKEAFHREAMKLHPDRYQCKDIKQEAEENFKRLQKAYAVLRDPDRRTLYHRGQL